jgi:hypothetical protein
MLTRGICPSRKTELPLEQSLRHEVALSNNYPDPGRDSLLFAFGSRYPLDPAIAELLGLDAVQP